MEDRSNEIESLIKDNADNLVEIASLRAKLRQQEADLCALKTHIACKEKEAQILYERLNAQAADLAQARQQIEKLEAAFLKLYIDAMRTVGMDLDVAEQHAREALEAIRRQACIG